MEPFSSSKLGFALMAMTGKSSLVRGATQLFSYTPLTQKEKMELDRKSTSYYDPNSKESIALAKSVFRSADLPAKLLENLCRLDERLKPWEDDKALMEETLALLDEALAKHEQTLKREALLESKDAYLGDVVAIERKLIANVTSRLKAPSDRPSYSSAFLERLTSEVETALMVSSAASLPEAAVPDCKAALEVALVRLSTDPSVSDADRELIESARSEIESGDVLLLRETMISISKVRQSGLVNDYQPNVDALTRSDPKKVNPVDWIHLDVPGMQKTDRPFISSILPGLWMSFRGGPRWTGASEFARGWEAPGLA